MGWVRLDDNFADHPKIIALSDTAFRLFITGLCYSNRQLTDGLIPYQIVNAWVGDNPLKPSDELEDQNLWERVGKGFMIRSYTEYQPTKEKVTKKRDEARDRLNKYRESKRNANETSFNDVSDTDLIHIPQPNPTHTQPNIKENNYLPEIPLPRVKAAKQAVEHISNKLAKARSEGINAWNLSKLVEEEWDKLHQENEIGACIALTVWYVSELQARSLSSQEISRIGQMTKRFGRISLLAFDEAVAKGLEGDMVSYAFRVAQNMYAERKA